MRFKGDIIITDPCYIIKSPEDYAKELGIPFPAYPKYTEDIKAYDKAMSEYRSLQISMMIGESVTMVIIWEY